jgi:hypothetical protein
VINVTAINPTSDGFVSLRPGDATGAPAVSTLNVTVGGTFPNGATITLPTSGGSAGQIQIWYEAYAATGGTTDLLIDVVGYYTNHNHDDRYYTETEVDTALASKADASELASKANTSDVNTAIAGKANISDLTSGLASKASVSDLTSGLADKADITSLMAPIVPSLPITLDSTGSVGFYSAITIGIDGNPVISYYDDTNGDLKVAACNNPTCTDSDNTTIDSNSTGFGQFTSIAIGTNGNPIISYADATNGDLKVAACNNPTCTTSTNTIIDSNGDVGYFTSITIGTNGNPIISYLDATNFDLKVAACNNPTCTDSDNTTIDSNSTGFGQFTSIAIGTNGNPIISYYDLTNSDLKVAACNNPTCTDSDNYTLDNAGDVGAYTSITIGTNGNPIISYWDLSYNDLKVAACKNPTCTESDNYTLDNAGDVGAYTSITIGTNGNPIISYTDATSDDLKVAACNNPTCTTSTNSTIDSNGNVGLYTSMTIGANGHPVISYYDATNQDLKVFSPWWLTGGR